MNEIDGSKIDLNLLAVLQTLFLEGSVTRAARRLGVGQPAASHALTRLRALFDDPLFVRVGRQITPTPRADALREPLARLLAEVNRLVHQEPAFDPARTTRSFSLVCPDLLAPVVSRLTGRLGAQAPHARLEVMLPRPDDGRALEEGRVDLALLPMPEEGPGLVRRGLGAVRFAVVARRDHPLGRARKLSGPQWASYPHVQVRTGHGGKNIVGSELARVQFRRRIGLIVPTFLSALLVVAETDLLFTAPRELVLPLADRFSLTLLDLPIAMAEVPVAAVWHERFHADPAQRFFRELVFTEVTAALRRPRRRRPGKR